MMIFTSSMDSLSCLARADHGVNTDLQQETTDLVQIKINQFSLVLTLFVALCGVEIQHISRKHLSDQVSPEFSRASNLDSVEWWATGSSCPGKMNSNTSSE